MLSRVADSLYWTSRYLERAEHTARLIDVSLTTLLDQLPVSSERHWGRVMACARVTPPETLDAYRVVRLLSFDHTNEHSIISCITMARENLRQVRSQVSSEMWEQANRLFLRLKEATLEEIWNAQPYSYFRAVKEGVHLFQGITDATMSHTESWHFLRLGRALERASGTALLLDQYLGGFEAWHQPDAMSEHYLEWVGMLKSCTAFEAYCLTYGADPQPDRMAEFLLLNADSPRSVRFAADEIRSALDAIAERTDSRRTNRASQLAGRLRAALNYADIHEIIEGGLRPYLRDVRQRCGEIHDAVYQQYVVYPIEAALAA